MKLGRQYFDEALAVDFWACSWVAEEISPTSGEDHARSERAGQILLSVNYTRLASAPFGPHVECCTLY